MTFSFATVEQAVQVLGKYKTRERLRALEGLGVDLTQFTHRELAEIVCASREKVSIAMGKLGHRRQRVRIK